VYEHIDELKAFRSMLPNEYVSTFDDAVMSMVPDSKERSSRLDVTKLDYRRYREAKQLFKIVIEFLLMRQ
jgi:intein-encoded DNA endonuclease-like protein